MSQSLLNKIWSFLAVVLLYLSLNVWSITQQWQLSLPGNPFKDGKTTPFGVALYGVLLCGPLLIVVCIIVHLYATRSAEKKWQGRFPRFGDFTLDMSRLKLRRFNWSLFSCSCCCHWSESGISEQDAEWLRF